MGSKFERSKRLWTWLVTVMVAAIFAACGSDSSSGTDSNTNSSQWFDDDEDPVYEYSSSSSFIIAGYSSAVDGDSTGASRDTSLAKSDSLLASDDSTEQKQDPLAEDQDSTGVESDSVGKFAVENASIEGFVDLVEGLEGVTLFLEIPVDDFGVRQVVLQFDSLNHFKVDSLNLEQSPYVEVWAVGKKTKAMALVKADVKGVVRVSSFSYLQSVRAKALMKGDKQLSYEDAMAVASGDVLSAFNLDKTDSLDAAGLAISLLTSYPDQIPLDSFEIETWSNNLLRAEIADSALSLDMMDGFAETRKLLSTQFAESVPGFEPFVRTFYQTELDLGTCKAKNDGPIYFVKNKASRYYASAVDDVSKSTERFVCSDKGEFVPAPDSLLEIIELGDSGKDGEIVRGSFSGKFYTFDGTAGAWRASTAVERDSYFVKKSATDVFVDIQDVYEGLKSNERIIFVLRHAERTDDTSKGGPLTSNGKSQSENVGKKLTMFEEPFRLGASQFVRAQQTVEYIAKGRGQDYDVMDTLPQLNDDWYVKNKSAKDNAESESGGGWEATSKFAYTGAYTTGTDAAYYNLAERSVELIEDVLLAKYNDPTERFVVLSSHDKLMVPLVVYCTDKKVGLKKYDGGKWLNYLAGVAIIIDDKNNRRYVPVKGLSSEFM